MLILNLFFFISFLIFAYFNLNDEDSWLWVPIYTIPAILCLLAVFDIWFSLLYLLLAFVYFLYATKLFFVKDGVLDWIKRYNTPSIVTSMKADKPYVEITREFFGLSIVIIVLLVNYFFISR